MNRPLVVILATVMLDSIGIGLVMPVIPALLRELSGDAQVAGRYGYFLAIYSLMQFVFSPVLGALSDRFGRRPVLLVSLAGASVDYAVMAFTPLLGVLYAGRVVAGITGANMAVATAYVADISREDERAGRFGLMNACFGLGFVAGPLLGGLVGSLSPRYPFLLAAAFNGLNFLLGLFVLPESRPPGASTDGKPSFSPFDSLRMVRGMRPLLPLLTLFFVFHLVGQVPGTIWVIYGEDRFHWDARTIGFSLAAFGILHAVSQAFLTGPTTRRLGERGAIVLGVLTDAAAYVVMALATEGWMPFAAMPLFTAGGIAMPALQSLLSNQVDEGEQGELQGILTSLMSLAAVFGPVVVTGLYAASPDSGKGLIWIAGASLYVLCFPALRLRPRPADPVE